MPELLNDSAIEAALLDLQAWARTGDAIERSFECGDFDGSIDFVNEIARLARAADHHPDLTISWGCVTVSLSTHSAGGITPYDVALAQQIDAVAR